MADVPHAGNALLGVSESVCGRFWTMDRPDPAEVRALALELDGDDFLAFLLAMRGVEAREARAFLDPKLRDLFPDPASFADMEKAAEIVLDAILEGRKVTVFADYDVDGATSAAQLARYFRAWGRELDLYVPDRIKEGYGPSPEAFEALKAHGSDLVITVDCGAAAYGALARAEEIGLPVVVIDHHLMQGDLPPAAALVNPNRPDCGSGCGYLAAAGVVFVFLAALRREAARRGVSPPGEEPDLRQWLDLAALGTICDVSPLTGVNRAIVSTGLKVMAQGQNPGLRALSDVAGIARADSVYHAGFVLGPRLNAGGRVGDPWLASRLLMTDDREEAIAYAESLNGLNAERKAAEQAILDEATAQAQAMLAAEPDLPVLVCAGEGWHPGIIGIVAGRLKEAFHKPAVLIGHGVEFGLLAKGSARSVPGINIGSLIAEAAKAGVIASGGGHAMAGGLSVLPGGIPDFRAWLIEAAQGHDETLTAARRMRIDGMLASGAATRARYEQIQTAGPFGAGAPEPRFVLSDVLIDGVRPIGENHLRFTARDETGSVNCIAWRAVGGPLGQVLRNGVRAHLAGHLKADDWNGRQGVRFDVEDAFILSV